MGQRPNLLVTMMVEREMDCPIAGADAQLRGVVAIIYRLRIVVEDKHLPRALGELSTREMDIQRLGSAVQGAVESSILPPAKRRDSVLLEGIAVENASSVARVRTKNGRARVRKHVDQASSLSLGSS
jgi:hypothetical protein